MKKLILAALLAVSVSACASVPGSQPSGPSPAVRDIGATVQEVRDGVVQACGYLPTVTTVANIVTTFTGGGAAVAPVSAVIGAICNAVTPPVVAGRRARASFRVNGVRIRGRFVR